MKQKENNTNGLALLIKDIKGFSQTQSAWRFYNNERVDIDSLNEPIINIGIKEINKEDSKYILIAHDWSLINYRHHKVKKDCIEVNRSNVKNAYSKGYELQSSLAMSIKGEPITPIVHNLKIKDKIFSTYDNNISLNITHLKELANRIRYINNELNIKKEIIHIIDREADSVEFLRELEKENALYIIRAIDKRLVKYNNEDISKKELSNKIPLGKYVKSIKYKNKNAKIYVNSVNIQITRDAIVREIDKDGKKRQKRIKGKALNVRFVVERVIDKDNNIIATWLLLTNLKEDDVSDKEVALWYYYRWNIESYFKLLKSSGFNLEKWQQREAIAIFKRLLIASYACILVWQIEHSNHKNIIKIKEFLVKLSGRLIQRAKVSTSPALLAGIWVFFSTMDILELYDIKKLFEMKKELNEFLGMGF